MAAKQAGLKLVQYVAVRGDLVKEWPLGAIVAQACHASTAVMHMFKDDPHTIEYLSDLDRMHKVVLKVCTIFVLTKIILYRIVKNLCSFSLLETNHGSYT